MAAKPQPRQDGWILWECPEHGAPLHDDYCQACGRHGLQIREIEVVRADEHEAEVSRFPSRLSVTAQQMDAVAALARLHATPQVLELTPGPEFSGVLVVESYRRRWLVDEAGLVVGEGARVREASHAGS